MSKKTTTTMVRLVGGPHDAQWLRIEATGAPLPISFIFGDLDPQEAQEAITAYKVTLNSVLEAEENESNHVTAVFTGQCNVDVMPRFLCLG